MSPKEICTKLNIWIVNFYLKSYIFCFYFTLYIHVWIRIRIPNTDPDPESSWIRIRIHNTAHIWLLACRFDVARVIFGVPEQSPIILSIFGHCKNNTELSVSKKKKNQSTDITFKGPIHRLFLCI